MRRAPRPHHTRDSLRGAAIRLVASVLIGVVCGVGATSTGPVAAATSQCGPAPKGQVAVVIVVDRAGATGTRCAILAQGATGLDALRAAGHTVRLDGGFVCAIDGLPATGCGNRPDAGFAHWRYWHAAPGGAWSYSQVGAGGYRLPARCAVEGWVWSDAPSSNTAPTIAAPVPACEVPSTTVPPTSAPPPAPGSAAPSAPGAPGGAVQDVPSAPLAATGDGGPGAPGATASTVPADVEAATTVPGAQSATAAGAAPESADGAAPGSAGSADGAGPDARGAARVTAGLAAVAPDGGTSPPWGPIVGVALIAGLGGAAAWRSRRRGEPDGVDAR